MLKARYIYMLDHSSRLATSHIVSFQNSLNQGVLHRSSSSILNSLKIYVTLTFPFLISKITICLTSSQEMSYRSFSEFEICIIYQSYPTSLQPRYELDNSSSQTLNDIVPSPNSRSKVCLHCS